MTTSEAMASEFGALAEWTAAAARELGADHYVPAGCRGSGGPHAFTWLLDRLDVHAGEPLLDVGAGVGGPSEYARRRYGVRPLMVEPEAGACRAATLLFDANVVQGDALALPLSDHSVAAAWCLGVLCTLPDHPGALRELARVLAPGGRAGLLVYARTRELAEQPAGNNFPTAEDLPSLFDGAGLRSLAQVALTSLPGDEPGWRRRATAVADRLALRHAGDEEWRQSIEQEATIIRLITSGAVASELFVLEPLPSPSSRTRRRL